MTRRSAPAEFFEATYGTPHGPASVPAGPLRLQTVRATRTAAIPQVRLESCRAQHEKSPSNRRLRGVAEVIVSWRIPF